LRPTRQQTAPGQTYFVTSQTWQRRALFNKPQWADLFLETLHSYRGRAYLLHEYVLMPEHFHMLITPSVTLERAVQFVKGGFSFRVNKELQSSMEVWQTGFSDHRIRDAEDYHIHVEYIYRKPVGRKLAESATEYPYCSAVPNSLKDEVPQWLKPPIKEQRCVAPKGATLQKIQPNVAPEAATLQERRQVGAAEETPLQTRIPRELGLARDDYPNVTAGRYEASALPEELVSTKN
jgi:putative transposase